LEKEVQTNKNDFNHNAGSETQEADAVFQEKVHEALNCVADFGGFYSEKYIEG
jgi:hypothetical protein